MPLGFYGFSDNHGIFKLNAKVSDGAANFDMFQQKRDCPKVHAGVEEIYFVPSLRTKM